jgi:FtsH-binding integral membrane protein
VEHAAPAAAALTGTTGFLQRVFGWMVLGLATTGAAAAAIGASDSLLTDITSNPLLLILIFGGQLALVLAISAGVNRLSPAAAAGLFLLYSALNGVIFAFVFELYTTESIFTTFLIAAVMFGSLALYGAVTKRDLTGLGPILFGALIALIVATFVNLFVGGSTLYWITTYAGVLIFAGLTAYDMQKLTRYAAAAGPDGRGAVQGALALYLDFINLFLLLLRIFGRSR